MRYTIVLACLTHMLTALTVPGDIFLNEFYGRAPVIVDITKHWFEEDMSATRDAITELREQLDGHSVARQPKSAFMYPLSVYTVHTGHSSIHDTDRHRTNVTIPVSCLSHPDAAPYAGFAPVLHSSCAPASLACLSGMGRQSVCPASEHIGTRRTVQVNGRPFNRYEYDTLVVDVNNHLLYMSSTAHEYAVQVTLDTNTEFIYWYDSYRFVRPLLLIDFHDAAVQEWQGDTVLDDESYPNHRYLLRALYTHQAGDLYTDLYAMVSSISADRAAELANVLLHAYGWRPADRRARRSETCIACTMADGVADAGEINEKVNAYRRDMARELHGVHSIMATTNRALMQTRDAELEMVVATRDDQETIANYITAGYASLYESVEQLMWEQGNFSAAVINATNSTNERVSAGLLTGLMERYRNFLSATESNRYSRAIFGGTDLEGNLTELIAKRQRDGYELWFERECIAAFNAADVTDCMAFGAYVDYVRVPDLWNPDADATLAGVITLTWWDTAAGTFPITRLRKIATLDQFGNGGRAVLPDVPPIIYTAQFRDRLGVSIDVPLDMLADPMMRSIVAHHQIGEPKKPIAYVTGGGQKSIRTQRIGLADYLLERDLVIETEGNISVIRPREEPALRPGTNSTVPEPSFVTLHCVHYVFNAIGCHARYEGATQTGGNGVTIASRIVKFVTSTNRRHSVTIVCAHNTFPPLTCREDVYTKSENAVNIFVSSARTAFSDLAATITANEQADGAVARLVAYEISHINSTLFALPSTYQAAYASLDTVDAQTASVRAHAATYDAKIEALKNMQFNDGSGCVDGGVGDMGCEGRRATLGAVYSGISVIVLGPIVYYLYKYRKRIGVLGKATTSTLTSTVSNLLPTSRISTKYIYYKF